ncbi:MAG: IS982 family transposase [Chitinophagales bacterium]|nr:IS982 family transposase [Chitinophagales bacterium]
MKKNILLAFYESSNRKVIEIFCELDDWCQIYERYLSISNKLALTTKPPPIACGLSISEIMSILVYYQLSHSKTFKHFYMDIVLEDMKNYFPKAPSYCQFVKLIDRALIPLATFLLKQGAKHKKGFYYADSKQLKVCHILREYQHKVFKQHATKGKSSTGWFFGFKLHLVINLYGEIVKFCFTPAHVADNNFDLMTHFLKDLQGKIYADKGYLSSKAWHELRNNGVQIITKLRKNMKNKLMDLQDKLFLLKRGLIESVFNVLTTVCDLEHSRHRNPINAFTHMVGSLVGYHFLDKKPKIRLHNKANSLLSIT